MIALTTVTALILSALSVVLFIALNRYVLISFLINFDEHDNH